MTVPPAVEKAWEAYRDGERAAYVERSGRSDELPAWLVMWGQDRDTGRVGARLGLYVTAAMKRSGITRDRVGPHAFRRGYATEGFAYGAFRDQIQMNAVLVTAVWLLCTARWVPRR